MSTLFRFATAGSVDDGKSTFVGRLLHDSKSILADQLDAISRTSRERGFGGTDSEAVDLALLTDGLRAEREQGITIDVAYRYFATARRTFILADCPGHVQYTKNTVTGASTADAVVILVDARNGVQEQTRRHFAVTQLLRVPHVVFAINKMDLVGFSAETFAHIETDIRELASAYARHHTASRSVGDIAVIPISALEGDNVVESSNRTPWYTGATLLDTLEILPAREHTDEQEPFRMPVQLVIRPQGGLAPGLSPDEFRDYRGYAGQIVSGTLTTGDKITVLGSISAGPADPTRAGQATVTAIDFPPAQAPQRHGAGRAGVGQSVVVRLDANLDIARGDVLAVGEVPEPRREIGARLAWLSPKPARTGQRVLVKHGTRTVQARIGGLGGRIDLGSFELAPAEALELNDIGDVTLTLASALPVEPYARHRATGAFLVIDATDGNTLAAGMVV
ncbi:sulfate adenylyltransferase subunit 1 [Haematomicrobium sanguinis]|uniref:sulfate adenylyltransferase subunit 1 n=1 Tax=Haematomicrobium sanguinis TaxID=479106 RepID=UPI00047DFA25|nr:GTP-binding protein [Haematomicrobium sanguinis]